MPALVRTWVFRFTLVAAVLAVTGGSHANEVFRARALGGPPSFELMTYVASAADGQRFAKESRKDLEGLTARALARRKCGSEQQGYLSLAGVADADADTILKDKLYEITWPACLYATSLTDGALPYRARQRDNIGSIWLQFTGSGFTTPELWREVTKVSNLDRARPQDLMPGDVLKVPVTDTTELRTKGTLRDFKDGLTRLKLANQVKVFDPTEIGGEILVPMFEGPSGQIANSGQSCVGGTAPPYDAALTAQAFAYTRRFSPPSIVKVFVVDNGFFGVRCAIPNGCPPASDPYVETFPKRHFAREGEWKEYAGIGPKLLTSLEPVNYYNRTATGDRYGPQDVNGDSGHGTHVAGLVLGGLPFRPYRTTFNVDSSSKDEMGLSWLQLIVLNVAGGAREIQVDAWNTVLNTVAPGSDRKVVNMSLIFTGSQGDFESRLRNRITTLNEVVFVVAAGNRGRDLEDLAALPARLSTRSNNVITVASLDANGQFSGFSNWGVKYADIAAPGCEVQSWLDGQPETTAASGTSQAAPLVSFAAALLRTLWSDEPLAIKNRLGISGDLIACAERADGERPCVAFQTALNPWKALLLDTDIVTLGTGASQNIRLGRFESVAEVRCGTKVRGWEQIKAIKRRSDGDFEVYWAPTVSGPVEHCAGKILHATPEVGGSLTSTSRIEPGRTQAQADGNPMIVPPQIVEDKKEAEPVDLAQLQEVIFRSRD
jgi:subtilisin family serine protease